MSCNPTDNCQGFSLLEVLVAFSIAAIALTLLLRVFGNGLNNINTLEQYAIAVQIAESKMASVGNDYQLSVGQATGVVDDIYRWQLIIEAIETDSPPNLLTDEEQQNPSQTLKILAVDSIVSWGNEINPRQVKLHTLKLSRDI